MDLQDLLPKNQKKLYGYHNEFNELVTLYKNKKKYLLINSNDSINKNKKIILSKTNKLLDL